MNININKETMKKAGEVGLKIGKNIIIEGVKAVAFKGAISALDAKIEGRALSVDVLLGEGKPKKKSIFKRKKKAVNDKPDGTIETIIEEVTTVVEEVKSGEA